MGSLVAALASYLDIRAQDGTWCVRIDDLDPPREEAGAARTILETLAAHGLHSDEPVRYQSDGSTRYDKALESLADQLFWCTCTRKSLAGVSRYPGTCRNNTLPIENAAIRLRADRVATGDFIVKRRDGLWAYNFATAVDDGEDFDRVLRGADLAHVTEPQTHVMSALGLPLPTYVHIPVLCYEDGTKLSKQTGAPALDPKEALDNLRDALAYLGQQIESVRECTTPEALLAKAKDIWRLDAIPARLLIYAAPNAT